MVLAVVQERDFLVYFHLQTHRYCLKRISSSPDGMGIAGMTRCRG